MGPPAPRAPDRYAGQMLPRRAVTLLAIAVLLAACGATGPSSGAIRSPAASTGPGTGGPGQSAPASAGPSADGSGSQAPGSEPPAETGSPPESTGPSLE